MMAKHGRVEEFNQLREPWDSYMEQLDLYFVANDITTEVKKCACTPHCLWPGNIPADTKLGNPKKPADVDYA